MPTAPNEEVDFSKSDLVIKAAKAKDIIIALNLKPDYSLNNEAPNGWKLQYPPKSNQPILKGQIQPNMKIVIPGQNADFFTLNIKLYLCSNGICTVRNKKITFELTDNLPENSNDFNIPMLVKATRKSIFNTPSNAHLRSGYFLPLINDLISQIEKSTFQGNYFSLSRC